MAGFTHSSGNINISGFVADSAVAPFAGTATFADPSDNYIFNWTSSTDADGNANGPQVAAVDATAHHWSLTVDLQSFTAPVSGDASAGNEVLMSGANVIENIDGTAVTFFGTGNSYLQWLVQSLHVDTPSGSPSAFQVSFTLDDRTDTSAGGDPVSWTEYFDNTPCFHTGTRIAVPGGETRVEALRIGDLVITADGRALPVKWLGRRSYTAAVAAANAHVRPVLIRRDAIAPGMPHRDLTVSAMHALFVDDAFIPAAALVNGVTILRCDELAAVSYVHIEMAGHEVIFAEGQPTETYVDDNSRQMFDNADEYVAMFGADAGVVTFSAPRLEGGFQLEAIRRRLAARAGLPAVMASTGKLRGHVERLEDGVLQGWVFDTAVPSTPVELEILVDGEVAATAIANNYRVDLDFHGLAAGRAGFSIAMPASVISLRQVTVRRIADGARVAMPEVALAD